jgi:hypothetical protein
MIEVLLHIHISYNFKDKNGCRRLLFFDDNGNEFDEMMEDHFRREKELITMATIQFGQSGGQCSGSVVGRRLKIIDIHGVMID